MSLFSESELFEVGTTNGDGTGGALRTDSTSQVQPSASMASGDAGGVLKADSASRVRPSYPANGDANTGALRADITSQVRTSSTANGSTTTRAAQADSALGVRSSSSRANSDATTGAAQADSASQVRPSAGSGDGTAGSVCVGLVDEAGLSDEGLRSRLKVLGRAESTLAAMKSRALAELSRRHNKRDAQRLIRDELQTSKRDAKRDVETATRLAELPATSGALNSGDIPVGHAQLIARAAGESPIDERLLVEAAGSEPFDEFMQTVKLHQRDVAADDGQGLLDRQRKKRKARIFESSDSGMFVLTGEFDQITGARIATALTAKERQLWHREDPNNRATPQQRMADALAELISEPSGDSRSVGTDLLVIADFDVLEQQLENPRLVDGSPIPITELHKMALEANLLPSIFDTKSQEMWLGRRVRTASEAQRIALIARDQHCIGCGANPLWCQAHHIIWWSKNGPTNLDNLVLVCNDCHHKIHDDGWQVHKHPKTGKYQLKPPTHPTSKRPAVSSSEPPTHPSDELPVVSSDKSARNSSGEPSTRGSGEFPAGPVGEPLSAPSDERPPFSVSESSARPSNERPAVFSNKSERNSSGESLARGPDEVPTVSVNEPLSDPSDKHPTDSPEKLSTRPNERRPALYAEEPPTHPADQRPTDPTNEPLAHQPGQRPTVLSDESTKVSSDRSSTNRPGQFPNVPVREPPTHPSAERPTNSTDKPRVASNDEPLAHQPGQRPTVLPDESTNTSSDGSSTNRPGQFPNVPVREPPTHPADQRPTSNAKRRISYDLSDFEVDIDSTPLQRPERLVQGFSLCGWLLLAVLSQSLDQSTKGWKARGLVH